MKPIPIRVDPDSGALDLFTYCVQNCLSHREAERGNHAIKAPGGAYERATIVLRLLLGEREWSDGYERKLDDCFEMGDGDAVCGWLLEFADSDPRIHRLLTTHSHLQFRDGLFNVWAKYRNAHRLNELALA